ncbi:MAG TPA: YetF domain-containing protein [Burkholderiaceae bacterium]|nr:YetF domain-containing protein [Burkholderiaceae bacterium]
METVLRVVVIYVFVVAGLRVLGKREFGQLSAVELVMLLMIPEMASQGLVGNDYSVTNALIGIGSLMVLVFVTSLVTHRFKGIERVIEGEPTVLVREGELLPRALNAMRVTPEEVFGEMHKAGLQRITQVQWAILEADGSIAIVPVDAIVRGGRAGGTGAKERKPVA